ncbi:hypothetical protein KXV49_000477, partial [Aspergillus fumigatus]
MGGRPPRAGGLREWRAEGGIPDAYAGLGGGGGFRPALGQSTVEGVDEALFHAEEVDVWD